MGSIFDDLPGLFEDFWGVYAGLLVNAAMLAEFACRRMLEQNTIGSNADGWQKVFGEDGFRSFPSES
jgi:hypothetical protein